MKKIDDPVTVVEIDGVLITAVGMGGVEHVSIRCENPAYVEQIKTAALLETPVTIIPLTTSVKSTFKTPLGLLAALMSVNPGRSRILEVPEETQQALEELTGPYIEGVVY